MYTKFQAYFTTHLQQFELFAVRLHGDRLGARDASVAARDVLRGHLERVVVVVLAANHHVLARAHETELLRKGNPGMESDIKEDVLYIIHRKHYANVVQHEAKIEDVNINKFIT